jgi:hypothetical protein
MVVMKRTLPGMVLLICITIFIQACSRNDDNLSTITCHTLEGCFANQKNCKSYVGFVSENKQRYKISIDKSSLCPSYFLQLVIRSDNNLVLDTIFTDQNKYEKIVEFNAGSKIDAEAILIPGQPSVVCVWAGKATISICKE